MEGYLRCVSDREYDEKPREQVRRVNKEPLYAVNAPHRLNEFPEVYCVENNPQIEPPNAYVMDYFAQAVKDIEEKVKANELYEEFPL